MTLGEERRQQRLTTRNTAPDAKEIIAGLHARRRGGVIGGEDLNFAPLDSMPELIDFATRSQRGSALGNRAELFEVVFVEHEIVWAGLGRDIEPAGACRGN